MESFCSKFLKHFISKCRYLKYNEKFWNILIRINQSKITKIGCKSKSSIGGKFFSQSFYKYYDLY